MTIGMLRHGSGLARCGDYCAAFGIAAVTDDDRKRVGLAAERESWINLGMTFLETDRLEVITGVNLPMLIKLAALPQSQDLLAVARVGRS